MKVDYEFSPTAKCVKPAKCQRIFCQRILSWLKMSGGEEPWQEETKGGGGGSCHTRVVRLGCGRAPVIITSPNEGELNCWCTVLLTCLCLSFYLPPQVHERVKTHNTAAIRVCSSINPWPHIKAWFPFVVTHMFPNAPSHTGQMLQPTTIKTSFNDIRLWWNLVFI